MCGIVGIVGKSNVNQALYDALTVLQHRGQDAAGIVTSHDGRLFLRKDNGLVRDVFHQRHMQRLVGHMGIGHVRYPTAGSSTSAEAQPFYVNSPYGITLAHNGNLTNVEQLAKEIYESDLRHVNTNSDSEVMLNVFAHELAQRGKLQPTEEDEFAAVTDVHNALRRRLCGGGDDHRLRHRRFPRSPRYPPDRVRPASHRRRRRIHDRLRKRVPGRAGLHPDSRPGPGRSGLPSLKTASCTPVSARPTRPDPVHLRTRLPCASGLDHRRRLGLQGPPAAWVEKLADKILRERPTHDIDVVIPIPDTSRTAALELANHLGVKFREGFVKNRYIGRTFIMPGQAARKKSVRQKLNAIELEFRGKNVMLVDDSIVRGTTCKQIIQMAREAGAKNVYFCSAAPAVRYPNVYVASTCRVPSELIAHNRTTQDVADLIGADWLIYQDLPDLIEAVGGGKIKIEHFDCAVFDGKYVTGDIDEAYLNKIENARNDASKAKTQAVSAIIDLYNN